MVKKTKNIMAEGYGIIYKSFEMKKQTLFGLFISKILTLKTLYEWGWLVESVKIAIVCILI